MSGEDHLELFKTASSQWLCDPYSVEIRFIAKKSSDLNKLLACTVNFWPIGMQQSKSLRIVANDIFAGIEVITDCSLNKISVFIENLEQGKLILEDLSVSIEGKQGLSYYTEMISNDRWFCDAHLIISGDAQMSFSSTELTKINSELRVGKLPFDGIEDLINYLNLPDTFSSYKQPQIEIRISPPVDIRIDESSLSKEQFKLTLHAHSKLNINTISLAVLFFPETQFSRKQVASQIKWKSIKNGRQIGKLIMKAENSFAVKTLLMTGISTIRRQFFEDILKVPNRRLFAISAFDNNLKKLRKDLIDATNSMHFEKAVNSLAYILGFSGCLTNESEAPDIILSTLNNNLVLIECTIKISDFNAKLGKLVDRKNMLTELLKKAGDNRKVHTYLVCGQPKSSIVHEEKLLVNHNVILLTKESLEELLEKLKFPRDPDEILLADERNLQSLRTNFLNKIL